MILIKDKENELKLIGNMSLEFYEDCKVLKVLNNLPIEIRRNKYTDKLSDIKYRQLEMLDKAKEEVKLREKLVDVLLNLEEEFQEHHK